MFFGYGFLLLKPRNEMGQAVRRCVFAMLRFGLRVTVSEMMFVLAMGRPREAEGMGVFCCLSG